MGVGFCAGSATELTNKSLNRERSSAFEPDSGIFGMGETGGEL